MLQLEIRTFTYRDVSMYNVYVLYTHTHYTYMVKLNVYPNIFRHTKIYYFVIQITWGDFGTPSWR